MSNREENFVLKELEYARIQLQSEGSKYVSESSNDDKHDQTQIGKDDAQVEEIRTHLHDEFSRLSQMESGYFAINLHEIGLMSSPHFMKNHEDLLRYYNSWTSHLQRSGSYQMWTEASRGLNITMLKDQISTCAIESCEEVESVLHDCYGEYKDKEQAEDAWLDGRDFLVDDPQNGVEEDTFHEEQFDNGVDGPVDYGEGYRDRGDEFDNDDEKVQDPESKRGYQYAVTQTEEEEYWSIARGEV
ncbi:hypothetical protein M231_05193 [Tremella mesenterica]|uniref:Uncharacterized protein n=1 Tax=Tremella mesenterica TaxID=5217 RepID=A0A4Q1BIS3_TREME|nr:uncharacterized protein TREMEDRAFT_58755 [Tremella mesenterica DSM 1558]EIW72584.1 hypothetical protein TREMEDRAFT_58755 [Tremella mesenterica DSM 1558]RXK37568.1 hypothetical protein M231_05193 [Tremella mesenterica]